MVRSSSGELVADATQKVPICAGCRGALTKRLPTMPPYALANDLWIGRLPPPLRNLTQGAKLLLPISRGIVRRFNCKTDSGAWAPVEEKIKAFVGNFVAFPQADGGRQVLSLPPKETDLVEFVQIVFAGSEPSSLQKARLHELGVSLDLFQRTYEYLRETNEQYSAVRWDDDAARDFAAPEGDGSSLLGLPRCLVACVAVGGKEGAGSRQEGPADAVEPGAGTAAPEPNSAGVAASAGDGSGAATDGGGQSGDEGGERSAAGPRAGDAPGDEGAAGGDGPEGDEGQAAEDEAAKERGEYSAAILDDDLQDLDRQWKQVLLGYQKMEQLHAEKQRVEASTRQMEGMEDYQDRDLECRMKEEAEKIQKAAEKCSRDVEVLKERVEY